MQMYDACYLPSNYFITIKYFRFFYPLIKPYFDFFNVDGIISDFCERIFAFRSFSKKKKQQIS